jgi:DNA-binding transcriptional ArsR family regulator
MSQPAISKHLRVLERAGLVARGRDAQRRPVRAEVAPLTEASAWIEEYRRTLEANFARLDALLESLKKERGIVARSKSRRPAARRARRSRKDD